LGVRCNDWFGVNSSYTRIQDAINQPPIFENASPKHTFTNKRAFLQNPHGRWVPLEHRRFQTDDVKVTEKVV
jgi:hypothetical protein